MVRSSGSYRAWMASIISATYVTTASLAIRVLVNGGRA
jgi:hypothetical protein